MILLIRKPINDDLHTQYYWEGKATGYRYLIYKGENEKFHYYIKRSKEILYDSSKDNLFFINRNEAGEHAETWINGNRISRPKKMRLTYKQKYMSLTAKLRELCHEVKKVDTSRVKDILNEIDKY